jgi:hypothetical protein
LKATFPSSGKGRPRASVVTSYWRIARR